MIKLLTMARRQYGEFKKITYSELHKVCLMSNVLLRHNVNKGDRVTFICQ